MPACFPNSQTAYLITIIVAITIKYYNSLQKACTVALINNAAFVYKPLKMQVALQGEPHHSVTR